MSEKEYLLEINSDPANLITVEEFINYMVHDVGVPEEKLQGLLISITEATTNAMIHANKKNPDKLVKIFAKVENEQLIISIKDQGEGFDPKKIPDPTEPENLLKDSGRGLYLMRFYMDDLRYNITPEGTETILVLNL